MTPPDVRSRRAPRPGFAVEAIALDLDGTCLDSHQRLHPRVRDCVRRVARRLPVVVATGRMYRSALPWARELGTLAPLVCYQGALVREVAADDVSTETLYRCELPARPALAALHLAREHNWHVNAYQDDQLLCEQDRPEAHLYSEIAQVPITFVDDLEPLLQRGTTKLACVITDPREVERCMQLMRSHLDGSARVTRSLPPFVEIVNPEVSKAVGAALALSLLGAALPHALAVGDAPNDVEMLDAAGFAVVVRTAPDTVAQHADATCAPPQDGGVADVLEALGLC